MPSLAALPAGVGQKEADGRRMQSPRVGAGSQGYGAQHRARGWIGCPARVPGVDRAAVLPPAPAPMAGWHQPTALAQTGGCQTAASLLGCPSRSCPGLPVPHSMYRALPVPMGAQDGTSVLSGMAWSQAQTCPWARTDSHTAMGVDMHTCMGTCAQRKAWEAAAVPSQGVRAAAVITAPLPARLGQQHLNPGA